LLFSDKRAGSKKQDLCALAGILVAWQVGVETYEQQMKKIINRQSYIKQFVEDEKYSEQIRYIARGTVLSPEAGLTIKDIKYNFEQMMNDKDAQE